MDHQKSVDYFKSVPWAAEILSQPGTHTFVPSHRDSASNRGFDAAESQDTLLAQSLNTPSAIPHCIGLYRDSAVATADTTTDPTFLIGEITLLFNLQVGTKGWSGFIHGGLQGVLVDEAMGNLMYGSNNLLQSLKAGGKTEGLPPRVIDFNNFTSLTAGITLQFLKPLSLPRVVAVTAKVSKIDGRKVFMDARVEGEGGVLFVKGAGDWRMLPKPGKKL